MASKEISGLQVFKVVGVVLGVGIAVWLLYLIRSTLLPFLTAFFVAYIVGPLVNGMESKGIKRIIGVLILYITLLLLTVSASLFIGPFLVHEIQDLSQRVAGEKRDWTFSISNVGGQDLTVEKIESSQKIGLDIIDPTDFPLIVEPFKQVKVTVRFSPPTAKPVWTQLQIYSNDPKRANDPVGIWLEANRPSSSLPRKHVDLQWGSNAYWPVIAVSDTAWYIGEVEPSYLAKFMDKIRALQPQFVGYLPILRGVDLAEEVSLWVSKTSANLVKQTPELIGGLISWITYVVIVPFVVFFLLSEGGTLKRGLIALVPNRYFELVLNLFYRIDEQLGGYIRGLIIYAMIVSGLSILGLWLIGLDYYLAIGLFTGLASIIPYFGAIMGVLLGSAAAIFQFGVPQAAIPVLGIFLVIHLLDGVFISPMVMAKNVDLHPIAIVFVLLIGGHLLGVLGMIIAVPLTAVVKVSTRTVYDGLKSYSV